MDDIVERLEAAAQFGLTEFNLLREAAETIKALRLIENKVFNCHQRALPANWVFTDCESTLDLMVAEITTQRHELLAAILRLAQTYCYLMDEPK